MKEYFVFFRYGKSVEQDNGVNYAGEPPEEIGWGNAIVEISYEIDHLNDIREIEKLLCKRNNWSWAIIANFKLLN